MQQWLLIYKAKGFFFKNPNDLTTIRKYSKENGKMGLNRRAKFQDGEGSSFV